MSSQRPRKLFDERGVCSAGSVANYKRQQIDWSERKLIALCDCHRKRNGEYDVSVPCSGGRGGGFLSQQLKCKYGMNSLVETWAPLKATDISCCNVNTFIQSGFHIVLGAPNGLTTRKLTRLLFKDMGDGFQPFICGQANYPPRISVEHIVAIIMYGEGSEVEYGGGTKNSVRPTRNIEDHYKHYFCGPSPKFWVEYGISVADLHPVMVPNCESIAANRTGIHFVGYSKFWDLQEKLYACCENKGFSTTLTAHRASIPKYASSEGQMNGFHYFLGCIKFSTGRTISEAVQESCDGKVTRNVGSALVKRYEGEFLFWYYEKVRDYYGMEERVPCRDGRLAFRLLVAQSR
jgi:hypothetical protein